MKVAIFGSALLAGSLASAILAADRHVRKCVRVACGPIGMKQTGISSMDANAGVPGCVFFGRSKGEAVNLRAARCNLIAPIVKSS